MTGAKLIKLPRDYTYMEELSWDRIDKKAAGTYGCRPTSLKSNSSAVLNNTVSFTVRGINILDIYTTREIKHWGVLNK